MVLGEQRINLKNLDTFYILWLNYVFTMLVLSLCGLLIWNDYNGFNTGKGIDCTKKVQVIQLYLLYT